MSLLLAVSPALPLGKAGKYVAAAYIVVFVVILAYVAIMAVRAQRTRQELDELRRDVEALKAGEELDGEPDTGSGLAESDRSRRSEQIA